MVCRNCGMNGNHPKSNGVCPATSESCNLCGKIGHFARKCMRNKQVRTPAMMRHGEHMQRQKANENRKINAIDDCDVGGIGSSDEDEPDFEEKMGQLEATINAMKASMKKFAQ